MLLHWVLEKLRNILLFSSQSVGYPSSKMTALDSTAAKHVESWILRQSECSRCMLPSDKTSEM